MPIPSHLNGYTSDVIDHGDTVSFILQDSEGGQLFRVYAYGEYDPDTGLYTDSSEGKCFFVAESVKTKEELTIFDNSIHGYDNMFVNDSKKEVHLVSELPFSPCRVMAQFAYEIPYDEEKHNYKFDSDGNCVLIDGRSIPWEQVKSDGYDWVTLCYENAEGDWEGFCDEELS
ncbi:MAG: hypothetical protein K2K57_08265 [Oscillospiraceae bacterium]|nr:hypothetical protein [Oscillospiraceae bacterium]